MGSPAIAQELLPRREHVSKRDANRELATGGEVDFTDHGHIAVLSLVKFPVQLKILVKILPSVAMSDVTT